jgi:WD40 repeat protein
MPNKIVFFHQFINLKSLRYVFVFVFMLIILLIVLITLTNFGESEFTKMWRQDKERRLAREKQAFEALRISSASLPEKNKILALAYLPDDSAIVSAIANDEGGRIISWNSQTGAQQSEFAIPATFEQSAFSPDAKFCALAGDSLADHILLWSMAENKPVGKIFLSPEERVISLQFSPKGNRLAATVTSETYKSDAAPYFYNNFSIKIWEAPDWKLKTQTLSTMRGGHKVDFSPDEKSIASSSDKNTVIWSIETGEMIESLESSDNLVTAVVFNPYDQSLITGDYLGGIRRQDRETKKWEYLHSGPLYTNSIVFSENGLWAASSHEFGSVQLLWRSKDNVDQSKKIMRPAQLLEVKQSGTVNCLVFSHSGKYLAAGGQFDNYGRNSSIKVWEVESSTIWSTVVE